MSALLSHFADEPFDLESRIYKLEADWKPHGFWFDVDGDWKRWCQGENFNIEGLSVRYAVELLDPNSILRLTDESELDSFSKKYGVPRRPAQPRRYWNIDWPEVGAEYRGILIAPYCWGRRHELLWYYGWDCASGCVWDTSAIKITRASVEVEQPA